MAKSTGLGKGLDALFAGSPVIKKVQSNVSDEKEEKIYRLKITEVEPNKDQARKKFNQEALDELAASIKRYGVIQPIIVSKRDGYYEIIAGERRWRASKKAGLDEIPCIIRNETEQRNKEISLIENIQREDLNPIEKALGYKELIENYNLKQQELADIIGKNRSTITNTLRILNLDNRVIELALEGKLTEGHCRSLIPIEDPDKQYKMALQIVETGGTVRDIERKVKNKKKVSKKDADKYEAIYKDIEDRFQGFFGTKVKLDAGKRKGKIIIEYTSNDDLERILELVNKEQ